MSCVETSRESVKHGTPRSKCKKQPCNDDRLPGIVGDAFRLSGLNSSIGFTDFRLKAYKVCGFG